MFVKKLLLSISKADFACPWNFSSLFGIYVQEWINKLVSINSWDILITQRTFFLIFILFENQIWFRWSLSFNAATYIKDTYSRTLDTVKGNLNHWHSSACYHIIWTIRLKVENLWGEKNSLIFAAQIHKYLLKKMAVKYRVSTDHKNSLKSLLSHSSLLLLQTRLSLSSNSAKSLVPLKGYLILHFLQDLTTILCFTCHNFS